MIVYSNSCSFGAAEQGHLVYGDLVAQHYSTHCVNRGQKGASNRRIIRTSLRDLIELRQQGPVIALIGLTFVSRTELWQPWLPADQTDGHFGSIEIDHKKIDWSLQGLVNTIVPDVYKLADQRVQDYYKNWLVHYNPESAVTDLLSDVIMFTGWCRSNNISYCVFTNPDVLPDDTVVGYNSPFISTLRQQVLQDANVINPWHFSFGTYALDNGFIPKDYEIYRQHGHPGAQAHEFFSKYLIKHLNKQHDTN
jgi:hypothetical protein